MGGILTIGIPKAWGVLDLGFTQETDRLLKSVRKKSMN